MLKKLETKINAFLEQKSKSNGDWAKVTLQDITDLHEIIGLLVNAKYEPDPDGDRPINWILVDRTRFEPMQFMPVRYAHVSDDGERRDASEADLQKRLDDNLYNLSIAMDRVNNIVRMRQFNQAKKAN